MLMFKYVSQAKKEIPLQTTEHQPLSLIMCKMDFIN